MDYVTNTYQCTIHWKPIHSADQKMIHESNIKGFGIKEVQHLK
jgi:hypothetical protein